MNEISQNQIDLSQAPAAQPVAGGGTEAPGIVGQADVRNLADAASAKLLESMAPKKRRGRPPGSKDKSPRKPASVAGDDSVAENAGDGGGEQMPGDGSAVDPSSAGQDFDEQVATQVVDVVYTLANDSAAAFVYALTLRELGDEQLATMAAQKARMNDDLLRTSKAGAVACARKYAVNMNYAPEVMALAPLVIWGGMLASQIKRTRAEGKKRREQ